MENTHRHIITFTQTEAIVASQDFATANAALCWKAEMRRTWKRFVKEARKLGVPEMSLIMEIKTEHHDDDNNTYLKFLMFDHVKWDILGE
jgi:hypothetical protein